MNGYEQSEGVMAAESQSQMEAEELTGVNVDEEAEELTPAEVLRIASQALVDENVSPKLLPHKCEYMDVLINQIEHLEKNIANEPDKTQTRVTAHRMELYRMAYITNTYFRSRLSKIETAPYEILQEDAERTRLGREPLLEMKEREFAEGFHAANVTHVQAAFLDAIPEGLRAYPVPRRLAVQRKGRVFVEVLRDDVDDIAIPDMSEPEADADVIVSLTKGGRYLVPFESVEEHLEKGKVGLI